MSRRTLLCLPFAGAGASFFYPWSGRAPDGLEVTALQLPGREWRVAEEPSLVVQECAAGLVPDVLALVPAGSPLVLFGHSLGAVLAFELARRLVGIPDLAVDALLVSGSPGPWTRRERPATGLPDDEFVRRIEEFAGYSHEALADPEMRELVLPTLRADVEMHESYAPASTTPLPVPVTAFHAADDDLVSRDRTGEWATATSAGFTLVDVPGGHMYLTAPEGADRVLAVAGATATRV